MTPSPSALARLLTLAEYHKLKPRAQGYAVYMQAEHPGSELKGCCCPYPEGSEAYDEYHSGQLLAVQHAQDSEE